MVALSRCLGSAALLVAADSARITRKRNTQKPGTKFIAGVPVLNYDQAYDGEASLGAVESEELEREWVVVVNPGTSNAQIKKMCQAATHGCNLEGHPEGGVPFLEMRGNEGDLAAVISAAPGVVKFVEPDQKVHMIPEIASNEVEAATWGLNRIGVDQSGRTGVGATIFVLDTGVRVSHNDFNGRAAPALDMTSGAPVECGNDLSCAGDVQGHGTHCAGTAGGNTFGVAPGSAVRSVKVLSDQGSGSWSWSYGALDWLAQSSTRPAVASMSLGGRGTQQAMKAAVDAAVSAGVVVVVAGGNSNGDACGFSPAFIPSAITVGSTTSTDVRSSFSNYGTCTEIWAPGSDVVSASHRSDDGSVSFSGTSMACPHVAGGAALVLEADRNKQSAAVLQELLDTAYLNVLTDLKTGDTNALLCVAEGGAPPTPTPVPTPAPAPGSWVVTGSGCAIDGDCIQSNNHPSDYGNNEKCSIELFGDIALTTAFFDTENSYDRLTVGSNRYSGKNGPADGSYSGTISWASDGSVTKAGWKLCRA